MSADNFVVYEPILTILFLPILTRYFKQSLYKPKIHLHTYQIKLTMQTPTILIAYATSIACAALLPLDVERLSASVGGYAVMNCHLDFPSRNEIPYHLQWEKDGEIILSWYPDDPAPFLADRFGGRVTRLSDGKHGLGRGSINVSAVRETDAGLYRCRVTFPNRSPPARNNGTFYYLDVEGNLIVTPPMNSTVLEGERAEFECSPKNIDSVVQWYKDGSSINSIPVLATRVVIGDNGSLVIPDTIITDPGEYECHVQSADGTVQSASAFLDVQYKAKVVYAPDQRYLPFGKPASLDCHFSANPPLTNLRWEKDGFLFDPYNVQGVFYSRNGSLLFNQIDESHEGSYSCTPYNLLGTAGPSPPMKVRVQKPPAFSVRPLPLYLSRLGATLTLPCTTAVLDNDTPPTIEWLRKDGRPLPSGRYGLDNGNLTISEIQEEDRGIYTCRAWNEASTIKTDTELLIENIPPRAPFNLTAVPSVDTIHVSWVPGHTGIEVDYNVWYRAKSMSEWKTMKILSRDTTEATIIGLHPGTEYELRILSQDHLGDGLFSKPVFVRTLDEEMGIESAIYAVPVTEAAGAADPLLVTSRLIDSGALVQWERDPADESRCTVWCHAATDQRVIVSKHTMEDYLLIPELKDGERYFFRVECLSGASGSASITVPEYGRLRVVAVGCSIAALLLAALAAALYFGRDRVCPRKEKRRPR